MKTFSSLIAIAFALATCSESRAITMTYIDPFATTNRVYRGDYNLDSIVNALDLDRWRSAYGADLKTEPHLWIIDGNSDKTLNGTDFLIWQRNFGRTEFPNPMLVFAEPGKVNAVPEPASTASFLLGLATLATMARRVSQQKKREA